VDRTSRYLILNLVAHIANDESRSRPGSGPFYVETSGKEGQPWRFFGAGVRRPGTLPRDKPRLPAMRTDNFQGKGTFGLHLDSVSLDGQIMTDDQALEA
jgi:hypothetical protein